MWWGHGFSWGWMLFGGLMMLLFWGGLFALLVLAVRAFAGGGPSTSSGGSAPSRPDTALNILKERYARGEISRADFEEMREVLNSS
ncbi:MAG: SHOCT domain-containing protein [Anaerolineae bacterium]